ncbi:bifunctional riboflavin kinase/FAD synthetase [bacterium]|nr:bifunctional riboflavin kinase/FAD synthetase [bacterium]
MEKYFSIENIPQFKKSIVTIGTFDGLHRGHQEILKHLVSLGQGKGIESIVVTFDPHPRLVLTNDNISLIQSLEQKLKIFEKLQIDNVIVIPFTQEFAKLSAKAFLDSIIKPKLNPDHIVIGYDHHFGKDREGSPKFMENYCKENNIGLDIINPVSDEGHTISSTGIRDLIKNGFVRRASFELGSVFGFYAIVVHGIGRGHLLDYPTANIIPIEENQLLPKPGVYFTRGRVDGHQLYGMCNFGVRPTFSENELIMEVHLFNPEITDLYQRKVYIEFLERIRDEKKFKSEDDLKKQLINDEILCKSLQKKYEQT